MPQVQLPVGCNSLKFPDGKEYYGKRSGHVNVDDDHAKMIARSSNGRAGIINGSLTAAIGTKAGRWCTECIRLWQSWSKTCPKCGRETEEE
jgi:hypothetical protein